MLIGEGPGRDEDEGAQAGRPFVGRAGRVLDGVLREVGLTRSDHGVLGKGERTVYITNIVRHRPPQNRVPIPLEVAACAKWLNLEEDLIKPRLIVCLGDTAAQRYFPSAAKLGQMRQLPSGAVVVSTYHPSYVLRSKRMAVRQKIVDDIRKALEVVFDD
jgi:DNA polymerase